MEGSKQNLIEKRAQLCKTDSKRRKTYSKRKQPEIKLVMESMEADSSSTLAASESMEVEKSAKPAPGPAPEKSARPACA